PTDVGVRRLDAAFPVVELGVGPTAVSAVAAFFQGGARACSCHRQRPSAPSPPANPPAGLSRELPTCASRGRESLRSPESGRTCRSSGVSLPAPQFRAPAD